MGFFRQEMGSGIVSTPPKRVINLKGDEHITAARSRTGRDIGGTEAISALEGCGADILKVQI